MKLHILEDSIFSTVDAHGRPRQLSLPALLAGLGDGSVARFSGMQRHQIDPFHMFLTALAAAVLIHQKSDSVAHPEEFWRNGLVALAGGKENDSAWKLIVDDPHRPAFMQPPVVGKNGFDKYKLKAATPDQLDLLQTAKNHDVKSSRMSCATAEAWCYALISCQTMSGFLGAGNYGIARMNGGFASRPCVTVLTSHTATERWHLETRRALQLIGELQPPVRPYRLDGYCLLWTVPWDGEISLSMEDLHPFFIEVCRLVRLAEEEGKVRCLGAPSKAPRVFVAKETKGNIGDPWMPVRRRDNAALTVSGSGFDLRMLNDLIVRQELYKPAPMQRLDDVSGDVWLHASVLARGQGTTDGYHEQDILIPGGIRPLLLAAGDDGRDMLAKHSEWAMSHANDVRSKCLRPALFSLIEGGPAGYPDLSAREVDQWTRRWIEEYQQGWQDHHFRWLWSTPDRDRNEIRDEWLRLLGQLASDILEQAITSAPTRTGVRRRARVRARGLYHYKFNTNFQKEMGYDHTRQQV